MGLWLLAFVSLPKLVYDLIVHKKYRKSLLARLGYGWPDFKKGNQPVIWMHAVSLGETKAMVSLARLLKQKYPNTILVISSITETGHAEAEKCIPFADYHLYLPFDLNFLTSRIVKRFSPDLVLLCESDFWYNFLHKAKIQGAKIGLINGKISERSAGLFAKFSFFSKRLFSLFDIFCLQNTLYRDRFLKIGIPEEKTVVTGNLKLDDEYPQLSAAEVVEWKEKLGITQNQLVLTIGATHHPEEQLLLEMMKEVWKKHPAVKVLLVPRHPERYPEVRSLLNKERLLWIGFTDISRSNGKEQVILIDAMGMIRMCYQLSDFSIVCGSYTSRVGGHNILESCWYGKPVLFGPHMHTQLEFVQFVKQYHAGLQAGIEELPGILERWITDETERKAIGENGLRMKSALKGSTSRTLIALAPLLTRVLEGNYQKKI